MSSVKESIGTYEKRDMKKKCGKYVKICGSIAAALVFVYCMIVFADIQPLRSWRNLWIETAMNTMSHQWLATVFIPDFVIDEVMSKRQGAMEGVAGLSYEPFEKTSSLNDVAHQKDFKLGENDSVGNRIIVNDPEQKIMISRAEIYGTVVVVMQIDDPSRVFMGFTSQPGESGIHITDFLKRYDAIAGINASGFEGESVEHEGNEALGLSMSEGKTWGSYHEGLDSICFTKSNRLIAGKIPDWDALAVRDGCQFKPVIIADGKKLTEGTGGYGINPRTCIGQRTDGSVLMLASEGRHSMSAMGITLDNAADIMLRYGADIAAVCDGGSSTIMAYDGKLAMRTAGGDGISGRKLPNAFLIKKIK